MKRLLKILLPIAILAVGVYFGLHLMNTAPKPERNPAKPIVPVVEVLIMHPQDYVINVPSRGTVAPRTQSTLVPEVAGRIVEVSANFRNGGFFEAGEVLVRIDDRDYQQALALAKADLAQARLTLKEESAQGDQALQDWKKLGMGGKPSDLVLRQPQMESARAAVAAAQARLKQAELDLERTAIRSVYSGRVLEKQVDVGQYVSPGAVLATLYAVDFVEVRLPLSDRQAAFVELPESYRGDTRGVAIGPEVILSASVAGKRSEWRGRIVRTEGAIDLQSRQQYVVAQVDDPYAQRSPGQPPLKIGQFVQAAIRGRTLAGVYLVPREAVRGEKEVLVIDAENRMHRRPLEVVWRDGDNLIVSEGLQAGERIALTAVSFATDGAPVRIKGEGDDKPAETAGVAAASSGGDQ